MKTHHDYSIYKEMYYTCISTECKYYDLLLCEVIMKGIVNWFYIYIYIKYFYYNIYQGLYIFQKSAM